MRFDVRSADGTPIGVWVDGEGPALVVVHGSIADHTTFASLVAALRDDVTTYALDRRGFAASGNGPFSLEVEIDDTTRLAADAIPGSRVHVMDGHGHFAHRADPGMVAGLVRDFMDT